MGMFFPIPAMPRMLTSKGDTKAGTLIGTDRYGNKYYENLQDELPRKAIQQQDHGTY